MAYTCTETCLVLAGIATHQHELHIDDSSANCTSPILSCNQEICDSLGTERAQSWGYHRLLYIYGLKTATRCYLFKAQNT